MRRHSFALVCGLLAMLVGWAWWTVTSPAPPANDSGRSALAPIADDSRLAPARAGPRPISGRDSARAAGAGVPPMLPAGRGVDITELEYAAALQHMNRLIAVTHDRFTAGFDDDILALSALREFREEVLAARPDAAADALTEYIVGGEDATTGLPFVVGEDGMMETVPTLRTAVLDLLPSTNLPKAAEISRLVLDQRGSAEEYALALRNLAWNDYGGDMRDEVARRLEDMLNQNVWREQASAGYLEALDAAVELGDSATLQMISSVIHAPADDAAGPAADLNRAAFIALDRMVVRNSAVLVEAFRTDPQLLAGAPYYRASLMSRLDISEPVQRETLLAYLARTDLDPGERQYFADLFPNANYLDGNWLITTPEPDTTTIPLRIRDQNAVTEVDRILGGIDANSPIARTLERIRARLVAFEQTNRLDDLGPSGQSRGPGDLHLQPDSSAALPGETLD